MLLICSSNLVSSYPLFMPLNMQRLCLALLYLQFLISVMNINARAASFRRRQRLERNFFFMQQQLELEYFMKSSGVMRKRRRFWRKERNDNWWDDVVLKHFLEEDWLEYFRMSSATFQFIYTRLEPYLQADPNPVRIPMSVMKKVAIALYKLASCAGYRVVADQFGTNKCMVHRCLYDVCNAIVREFRNEYLSMPNEFESIQIAQEFEAVCGIPQVVGALDCIHIPVLPPSKNHENFVNQNGWTSYNMLAVVDSKSRFRYAMCKHPGRTHDESVLKDSNLYKYADEIIHHCFREVDGVQVPYFLLGNPACPLLPWLINQFKENLSPEEESFNTYHSLGRTILNNAIGRLKARFRCLSERMDINYHFVPTMVLACLILHNIIETREDIFYQKWQEVVDAKEMFFPQPTKNVARNLDDMQASTIRNALKNYMTKFPLRKTT